MQPLNRRGLLAVVGGLAACSSRTPDVGVPLRVDSEPPLVSADPRATAEPPASAEGPGSAPSTSVVPTSTVASPPGEAFEARFLPLDARCEKDADCAVTKRGVGVRLFCCDACDAVAGGKAWVARADLRCSVYDKEPARHACPARDCAAPRGARCNHGACELLGAP